jgi:uncharacterized RDD family membrane protein YckC
MERMGNHGNQLDTSVEIVTPENIAFQYRVAGPFRRLPAYLIDLAIRVVVLIVISIGAAIVFGIANLPATSMGLTAILWFLASWFYGGVFETFWNGQTPGKRVTGLRVVSIDGQPIHGWQAILRNILRAIDSQPLLLYQVGLLSAMMNDRFQRLGDLACGTMVIVEQRNQLQGVLQLRGAGLAEITGQIPPNFQVNRTLGLALTAYVQRRQTFSKARRLEIARHLGEPLRERFGLPNTTDLDLLLCGLYQRAFQAAPTTPFSGQGIS